jgi:hypothetical protein
VLGIAVRRATPQSAALFSAARFWRHLALEPPGPVGALGQGGTRAPNSLRFGRPGRPAPALPIRQVPVRCIHRLKTPFSAMLIGLFVRWEAALPGFRWSLAFLDRGDRVRSTDAEVVDLESRSMTRHTLRI